MKLRHKTILIVSSTTVILVMILYLVSKSVMMNRFADIEYENTAMNIMRVREAFNVKVNNLSSKAADWAKWDDTYTFIVDSNEDYITSNLKDESFNDLNISLMIFVDTKGKVIFSRGFDPEIQKSYSVPESILRQFLSSENLIHHKNLGAATAGLFMINNDPMIIVSRPILTSDGKGPARGTLIFGQQFGRAATEDLAQVTHLELKMEVINKNLSSDMYQAFLKITNRDSLYINPVSEVHIAGYTTFRDVSQKPVLLARIVMSRNIYQQGQRTVIYMLISISIAGLIFGIVILFLLERTVLSRVARINTEVNLIGRNSDHSARVTVSGKDELSNLGKSVNEMLSALEATEREVSNRNREMSMIMNTVQTGLLSLNEHLNVNPEYSKAAERILGQSSLSGKSYFDILGLDSGKNDEQKKISEFLDFFRQELIPEREMAALNPFEELSIRKGTAITWIKIRYFLIRRGDLPSHILVVIDDITEEKILAEKVRQSERENMQLKAIAEDPDLFRDLLVELKHYLNHAGTRLRDLSPDIQSRAIVNEIFRDIHTIKGTAGAFSLAAITEIAGDLENRLNQFRESGNLTVDEINAAGESLGLLSQAVMDVVGEAKKIMGDDVNDSSDIILRISLDKIKKEKSAIINHIKSQLIDQCQISQLNLKIEQEFSNFRSVPAKKGLAKALKTIPALITKLEKDVVFEFEGADELLDCEIARELNMPLVHLIRNCFDHGIETSEERMALGKSEQGYIKLCVKKQDKEIQIEIGDDGKGLDPEKLKKTAVHRGLITEQEAASFTREEAYALILRPGFSTAELVSEISGRGVGMDAVWTSVKNTLKGDFSIQSEVGKGTVFVIRVPDVC